jgi:hypothetical protein
VQDAERDRAFSACSSRRAGLLARSQAIWSMLMSPGIASCYGEGRTFQWSLRCDHGRIDDAEGKAHVLLDDFRDARDITFLDLSNVEAVAAE